MNMQDFDTRCIVSGQLESRPNHGTVNPIYPATTYEYIDQNANVYPRYFNTPNQAWLNEKIATLEGAAAALTFGSGMAAISTSLMAFLAPGDHVIVQNSIYGGTTNFINKIFHKYGIEFTVTDGRDLEDFARTLQENTRMVYIETPSNPLLAITDIRAIAGFARSHQLISMIDNTFASPVNQTPYTMGIDVVLHSATKYLGGHSDICAGFAVGSQEHIDQIWSYAKCFGGSLNAQTCHLLERSMKTLGVRVRKQNQNAMAIASFLENHPKVERVFYPGLVRHPGHEVAVRQMSGFGGMVSFELRSMEDPFAFQQRLRVITPTLSLGGVESTICSPFTTSHDYLSKAERLNQGIRDELLRLSVGIESEKDLVTDIAEALQ